jgi:hypothetical protein
MLGQPLALPWTHQLILQRVIPMCREEVRDAPLCRNLVFTASPRSSSVVGQDRNLGRAPQIGFIITLFNFSIRTHLSQMPGVCPNPSLLKRGWVQSAEGSRVRPTLHRHPGLGHMRSIELISPCSVVDSVSPRSSHSQTCSPSANASLPSPRCVQHRGVSFPKVPTPTWCHVPTVN